MDRVTNVDSEFQLFCSITDGESVPDEEIIAAVRELKNSKTIRDDGIAAEFLKLVHLNSCLVN